MDPAQMVVRHIYPPDPTGRLIAEAPLRPEVMAFALIMEAKLKENDYKGGWSGMDPLDLLVRLREETEELNMAILSPRRMESLNQKAADHRACCEAADVANFAMMIADNVGGLGTVRVYGREKE